MMEVALKKNPYWDLLKDLNDDLKVDLINLLAKSLVKNEKEETKHTTVSSDEISDAWCNDGLTAEEEIALIRESRVQGVTRKIMDL